MQTQAQKLFGQSVSPFEVKLAALQSQAQSIASGVQAAIDDLLGVQDEIEAGQEMDATSLSSIRTQIISADAVLQSVIGDVETIRAQQTDVLAYANILALEDRFKEASSIFANVSEDTTNFGTAQIESTRNQWLDVAVEQTTLAEDALRTVTGQLELISREGQETSADPGILLQMSNDLKLNILSLEIVSNQLNRAKTDETDAERFTQILVIEDQNQSARTLLLKTTTQVEQLGQTPVSEESLYSQLIQSQRQLQLSGLLSDAAAIRVANPAESASAVQDSSLLTNTMLAAGAGLLIGVLAVLAQEYLDRRLRTLTDVKRYTDIPSLGAIPIAPGKWKPHPPLLSDASHSQFAEALRLLRTNVEVWEESKSAKVLMVTSPGANEGKTTVALNLARSMAMAQKRVLLIDANLHKPEIGPAFALEEREGFEVAIRDGKDPAEFIAQVDGVHVLAVGQAISNPSDILSSALLRPLLDKARQDYDVILLDSPPVIGFADTLVIAKNVDSVLLVLRASRTTSDTAQQSVEILQSAGVQVMGAVLDGASRNELGPTPHKSYRPKAKQNGKFRRVFPFFHWYSN